MSSRALFAVLCHCALGLVACDRPTATPATPDASGEAAADMARGELLSFACQACHTLEAGGAHLIGPNLHGVFGRQAGRLPDFEYSRALRASSIVWTPEVLDAWLADPAGFIDGTTMTFAGYRSERDRRDLLAFLVEATSREPL